ncbi:MAG: molecular chaperone DnaK [Myxococcota bacterium]|nr:molecular chaperone DnaK [Myxococcota bacterium]
MERIIGIDLGTTNSCVALVEGGVPVVLTNQGGYKTTPSVVAVSDSGKRLVGHIAKRQSVTNAANTVYAAKRLIGRRWGSPPVRTMIETMPYTIVEGPNNDPRIQLRDRVYSIPELSSIILQEMRLVAEEYTGDSIQQAVITVPAYFNDSQRQATKAAGEIAGLDVLRIINEPTAAALAYGYGREVEKTVAVYDLGGGTFDISILSISDGVFEVLATAGDTFLGGEDFDGRIIMDWLVLDFAREHQIDLRRDRMALQRLRDAAEKAKCELSSSNETEINLPFIISTGGSEALHLQKTLSRQKLEELTVDLVERTTKICRQAVEEAGETIDEVLLVGGMTRMPLVQQKVRECFGLEPLRGVHPEEVVALGAAIQGASLFNEGSSALLLDVTPHSLGIMVHGGLVSVVIPQNTTVPTSKSHIFTTVKDNQTSVKILVMQGDSDLAAENEMMGEFILTGLRAANAGEVEIEVTFDNNADGIVAVSAKDLETGQEQAITVTASAGLTPEEIESMIRENQDHLVSRRSDEAVETLKLQAQRTLMELERLFPQVRSLLDESEFGQDAIRKANGVIDRAKLAIAAENVDELKSVHEALNRTHNMFKGVVQKIG